MYTVLIVFHVLLAIGLVAIILVQRGPGATMGAAFGSGASGTVFGSRGAAGFLVKLTSWMGVAFFAVSLAMAMLVARTGGVGEPVLDLGVMDQVADPVPVVEPVSSAPQAVDLDEFLEVPADDEAVETLPEEPVLD